MLFYKALIAGLFAAAVGAEVVDRAATPSCEGLAAGTYPVKKDCTKYFTCPGGAVSTCAVPTTTFPIVGMWSSANGHCVLTVFPGCFSKKKFCDSLPDNTLTIPTLPSRSQETFGLSYFSDAFESLREASIEEQQMSGFVADKEFECPEESGYFGVENQEASYRICVRGEAFVGQCENGGVFDATSKTCVDSREGTNKLTSTDKLVGDYDCTVAVDGLFGFEDDCKVFQVCCGAESTMLKCPLGLKFDTDTRTCTFGAKATCESAFFRSKGVASRKAIES